LIDLKANKVKMYRGRGLEVFAFSGKLVNAL
jgi:hypothetical protein